MDLQQSTPVQSKVAIGGNSDWETEGVLSAAPPGELFASAQNGNSGALGVKQSIPYGVPQGGTPVGKAGVVFSGNDNPLKLRSSPNTSGQGNILRTLPFNTTVMVIKSFPGDWYYVSTEYGEVGYVAKAYVKTNLPEPNAKLHKVEGGEKGTAIAIAERYFKPHAKNWGQDLRFFVAALAHVNNIDIPNQTDGWKKVKFNADNLIWIPSVSFCNGMKGVLNSGSISYEALDNMGLAKTVEKIGRKLNDFKTAMSLSMKYMPAAIKKYAEAALMNALMSIVMMLVLSVAILAISTAVGAAIGGLAGGVGAVPGAAAGFEVGMILLQWMGLAMLIYWVGDSLVRVGGSFGRFLGSVWKANGDQSQLDQAAKEFAEAIGLLLGIVLEAILAFAISKGLTKALSAFQNSQMGKAMGETKANQWLNERIRKVSAGETLIKGPLETVQKFYRGVEIVDGKGSPLGEFDGVNMSTKTFVENKSASGLNRINPSTKKPAQTPTQWAQKQITGKSDTRIKNLAKAVGARPTVNGSKKVPSLTELQSIRKIHFVLDGDSPALRAAVTAELAALRSKHPGWTFTAEYGTSIFVPPAPNQDNDR